MFVARYTKQVLSNPLVRGIVTAAAAVADDLPEAYEYTQQQRRRHVFIHQVVEHEEEEEKTRRKLQPVEDSYISCVYPIPCPQNLSPTQCQWPSCCPQSL